MEQNINYNDLLMTSVIRGDFDGIDEALSNGADLFQKTTKGNNLLYVAASRNRFDVFNELLDVTVSGRKIDINEQNFKGETLLMQLVTEDGYDDYIKILLNNNANPNIPNNEGMSPLIQACADKKVEQATLLINAGADLDYAIPNTKTTAFLMAASQSSMDICELLKSKGANVNCLDAFGKNALLTTIYKSEQFMKKKEKAEHAQLCLFLSNIGIDINYVAPSGMTALWAASLNRNPALVNHLLDLGANADVSHEIGLEGTMSALHLWMNSNDSDLIERLIKSGAKLGLKDSNGNTPDAIGFMNPHLRDIMIDLGADVNSIYYIPNQANQKIGMPVITSVISSGNKQDELVEKMIQKGAHLTFKGTEFEKFEPIMAAITSSAYSIVERILKTGKVDVNSLYKIDDNSPAISPLSLLVSGGLNSKLASHLQKKAQYEQILKAKEVNDKNNVKSKIIDDDGIESIKKELESLNKLEENIQKQKELIFNILVENNVKFDVKDELGRTPIYFVNDEHSFNLLKSNILDLSVKDEEGNTPLVYSILNNKSILTNCIKNLNHEEKDVFYQLAFSNGDSFYNQNQLLSGLLNYVEAPEDFMTNKDLKIEVENINFTDDDGNSPLLISCANNLPFLASIYIKMGADINHQNSLGETPLMHSISSENPELVDYLISNGAKLSLLTNDGKSALDFANELGNLEIIEKIKTGLGLNQTEGLISGVRKLRP